MVKKLNSKEDFEEDFEEDEQGGYCFEEEMSYGLNNLGNDAWATGCPLCGSSCWNKGKKEKSEAFDKILGELL
jgi:hypothetical protein